MDWLAQDWEREYLGEFMYTAPEELTQEVILPAKITFKNKKHGNIKRKISNSNKSRSQFRRDISVRVSRKRGKS